MTLSLHLSCEQAVLLNTVKPVRSTGEDVAGRGDLSGVSSRAMVWLGVGQRGVSQVGKLCLPLGEGEQPALCRDSARNMVVEGGREGIVVRHCFTEESAPRSAGWV